MNPVNKVIFNALVSHRDVALPGVGTIVFERRPAELKGKRKLIPPRNAVRFIAAQQPGAASLAELVAQTTGDRTLAETACRSWMAETGIADGKLPGTLAIEGVGTVRDGEFTPDPELDRALNLGVPEVVALPSYNKSAVWTAVGVAAAVIALILAYPLVFDRAENGGPAVAQAPPENPAQKEETPADEPAAQPEGIAAPDSAQPGTAPAVTATGGPYHLIINVFSTRENADRFIRESGAKAAQYTVIEMPKGRFGVSCGGFDTEQQAESARQELSSTSPGAWIYKLNRGV